jgi:hypothetical protein
MLACWTATMIRPPAGPHTYAMQRPFDYSTTPHAHALQPFSISGPPPPPQQDMDVCKAGTTWRCTSQRFGSHHFKTMHNHVQMRDTRSLQQSHARFRQSSLRKSTKTMGAEMGRTPCETEIRAGGRRLEAVYQDPGRNLYFVSSTQHYHYRT